MERLAGLISANYNDARFGKLTAHRPIAGIPFGSRYRLIDFSLSNMVNSGMTSVGLITPHLYRSLMDHLGSGKEFGLSRKTGGLYILPGSTYGYNLGKKQCVLEALLVCPFCFTFNKCIEIMLFLSYGYERFHFPH